MVWCFYLIDDNLGFMNSCMYEIYLECPILVPDTDPNFMVIYHYIFSKIQSDIDLL